MIAEKGCRQMDYQMVYVAGHVEVLDQSGRFIFSADTREEAWQELAEYMLCA